MHIYTQIKTHCIICKRWHGSFHHATNPAILQSRVYNFKKNTKKIQINLHISKKSSTFAPNLKNNVKQLKF